MASEPATASNESLASWAIVEPDPGGERGWLERIRAWWAEFSLQTKLLAVATLVVSLMMTGITFFALNGIQRDAAMNDTRYARDLGLLLAGNVSELVAEGRDRELANVAETFWRSSRSLRYIFFADPEGIVYLGIPISGSDSTSDGGLRLNRRLELPAELQNRPPIQHDVVSVTVVHGSAMMADAWATALIVLGSEKAMVLAEERRLAVYLLKRSGDRIEALSSASMAQWLDED